MGRIKVYRNGERYELGEVKTKLDEKSFRINYHTGDTSARTSADLVKDLENEYAFLILRRSVETNNNKILDFAAAIVESLSEHLGHLDEESYVAVIKKLYDLVNAYEVK